MFVVVVVLWRCVRVLGGLSTATTKETLPLTRGVRSVTPPRPCHVSAVSAVNTPHTLYTSVFVFVQDRPSQLPHNAGNQN